MKTLTITNQKGGVGKTTVSLIIASGLVSKGYRVLSVDSDPQGNFTYSSGIEEHEYSLYELLRGEKGINNVIRKSSQGYDLIPSSIELAKADKEFVDTGKEYLLKEALTPIEREYDFCIIDTPPTLSILTINALTTASEVIVPMSTDIYSLTGLEQLYALFSKVRKYTNPSLRIGGIVLNKFNSRAIINRQIKEKLENNSDRFETRVFKSTIREGVLIKEIQFLKKNIFEEKTKSKVLEDCKNLIDEIIEGER